MAPARIFLLTLLAMIAFASNSLLCRVALKHSGIDAASFTFIRIVSGAAMLALLATVRGTSLRAAGNWLSALALFTYAAAFSFAYLSLTTGTGALLLFGAVQATMILWSLCKGDRLHPKQLLGLILAMAGLVMLLLPGLSSPPLLGSLLMLSAGAAWGIYSLRGKSVSEPFIATTGNFIRAVPLAAVLSAIFFSSAHLTGAGITCAILSGAIASGLGYTIWYSALPALKATSAATVQLSVPVLAAVGGILLLGEPFTLRFLFAAIAILGGIALVVKLPRMAAVPGIHRR